MSISNEKEVYQHLSEGLPFTLRGSEYAEKWALDAKRTSFSYSGDGTTIDSKNRLKLYFDTHKVGRGIWKWIHYFDIYQRHFSKFVGREVHVLEIGIYSGGSLHMWEEYFGLNCHIYGVDIEQACKAYEGDRTKIFIGDQADREFWKGFKKQVPKVDIVIDDGGHKPEQQLITLEEMLSHLRPGGVYLCEDVHGNFNNFCSFVHGLASHNNSVINNSVDKEKGNVCTPSPFQEAIHSIHFYPYAIVIERNSNPIKQFIAPKHGTEWQPFL